MTDATQPAHARSAMVRPTTPSLLLVNLIGLGTVAFWWWALGIGLGDVPLLCARELDI